MQQIVNNLPTTYTLDLAAPLVQVLTQQDADGETAYLYGLTRIGEQQPDGWAYHLSDARPCPTLHRSVGGPLGVGSVRQLADVDGQVTLAHGYTPYGEALWSEGTGQSAYGFTGEDFDVSTGLVFLQARYMSPRLGIFLSHDPWSGDVLRPRSMNGWIYVEGNPVNFTDRTGEIGPCLPPNSLVRDPETGQLRCVSPWGGVIGGVGVGTLPGTGGAASELLKWLARIGVGICTGVLAETLRLHGPHVIVELGAGDYSNAIAMKEQFPYAVVIATNLVSEWDFGRMLVKYHHTPDPFTTQFPMDMYIGWEKANRAGVIAGPTRPIENHEVPYGIGDIVYTVFPAPDTAVVFGILAARIARDEVGTIVGITAGNSSALGRFMEGFKGVGTRPSAEFKPVEGAPFGLPYSFGGQRTWENGLLTMIYIQTSIIP